MTLEHVVDSAVVQLLIDLVDNLCGVAIYVNVAWIKETCADWNTRQV